MSGLLIGMTVGLAAGAYLASTNCKIKKLVKEMETMVKQKVSSAGQGQSQSQGQNGYMEAASDSANMNSNNQ